MNLLNTRLNTRQVPVSRHGSHLCFIDQQEYHFIGDSPFGPGLYLRLANASVPQRELCHIGLAEGAFDEWSLAGRPLDEDRKISSNLWQGFPGRVQLVASNSQVVSDTEVGLPPLIELLLDTDVQHDSVHLRGTCGVTLRIPIAYGVGAYALDHSRCILRTADKNMQLGVEVSTGQMILDAPWRGITCEYVTLTILPDSSGKVEAHLDRFSSTWVAPPRRDFDTCVQEIAVEFQAFVNKSPEVSSEWENARIAAAYIHWANAVYPEGALRRTAIYMSKSCMSNVWSWDNCFNTMALCQSHPQLAWDQMMLFGDYQDEFGAFPDWANATGTYWPFCKPPVYGLTYRYCLEENPDFFGKTQRMQEAYDCFSRNTRWWLEHRVLAGRTLPYYSHGNEGWDTSTLFDVGAPIESPDLGAYIVLQTEVLGEMASRLGRDEEATQWQEKSQQLLTTLVGELWSEDDDRFVGRLADGRRVVCDSSIVCLPVILGQRLPSHIRESLCRRLSAFVTPHGVATELPTSPKYDGNGHWRGPIWAPTTWLFVQGLRECGEVDLANQIAEAYCCMTARGGFFECFDALTGEGLREWAYSWSANVFFLLGQSSTTIATSTH